MKTRKCPYMPSYPNCTCDMPEHTCVMLRTPCNAAGLVTAADRYGLTGEDRLADVLKERQQP